MPSRMAKRYALVYEDFYLSPLVLLFARLSILHVSGVIYLYVVLNQG